ncbi:hypothetical protein [Agrobacterium fabrum]|uniref:hypothetical protein n=1 Tax=Agrobacterium fabrum TaxID=1176649 RepID=UPI003BA12CBA
MTTEEPSRHKEIDNLHARASTAGETLAVYEDGRGLIIVLWALASLLMVPVIITVIATVWNIAKYSGKQVFTTQALVVFLPMVILLPLAMAIINGARHLSRRRAIPFVVFSEQGLQYPDLAFPIPWTEIRGYELQNGFNISKLPAGAELPALEKLPWNDRYSSHFRLVAHLREDYQVPIRKENLKSRRYSVRRVWYYPEGNWVIFKTLGVRGMSNQELLNCFNSYWQSGLTRAKLRTLRD